MRWDATVVGGVCDIFSLDFYHFDHNDYYKRKERCHMVSSSWSSPSTKHFLEIPTITTTTIFHIQYNFRWVNLQSTSEWRCMSTGVMIYGCQLLGFGSTRNLDFWMIGLWGWYMNTRNIPQSWNSQEEAIGGEETETKEEDLLLKITLVPTLAERRIYRKHQSKLQDDEEITRVGKYLFHPNFTVNTFLITYIYELIIRSLFFIINFSSGKRRGTTNQIRTVIAQNRSWAIFRELEEPDTTHKNNNLRSTRFLSSLSLSLFPFSFQHIIIIEFTGDTYRFNFIRKS